MTLIPGRPAEALHRCERGVNTTAQVGLRAMRELGWVETQRRGVTVLDLDALRRRVS